MYKTDKRPETIRFGITDEDVTIIRASDNSELSQRILIITH